MRQDTFSAFHPVNNFLYFVLVIGCSMFLMHPVFLGLSCLGGMAYYIYLKHGKALKTALWLMLPVFLISAAVNPLFNHQGITLILYLKSSDTGVDSLRSGGWCYAGQCAELVFLLSGGYDFRQIHLSVWEGHSCCVPDFIHGASFCAKV